MRKFFGKNQLNTKDLFEERKKYQEWMEFYTRDTTNFVDLWYDFPNYGRVNKKGEAIYPAEGFLKSISQRNGEELYLINFAADMFNDFVSHWNSLQSSKKLHQNSKLLLITPVRAWQNVHTKYHTYVRAIYQGFLNKIFIMDIKIKNFEHMVDLIKLYTEGDSTLGFVRKSEFVLSKYSDPLISGLMVEIDYIPHDLDKKKEDFINDANFLMFKKTVEKFNFKLDENAPWRMIADLDSPRLNKYLTKYEVDKNTLYEKFFYKAEDFDIENIKEYLMSIWNELVDQNRVEAYVRTSTFRELQYKRPVANFQVQPYNVDIIPAASAVAPSPDPEPEPAPTYGETYSTIETLQTAISETPELFTDGTAVYITTINYNTPAGDDPISSSGWVIVHNLIPVPVLTPTMEHYEYWIDTYSPPTNVWTYVTEIISGSGDGGGYVANVDGEPIPTSQLAAGGACASNMRTGGNTDIAAPMNRDPNTDVNLTTNYDATALPTVDDVP